MASACQWPGASLPAISDASDLGQARACQRPDLGGRLSIRSCGKIINLIISIVIIVIAMATAIVSIVSIAILIVRSHA